MALPLYLAETAAEFKRCSSFPEKIAWMACHFSPYGTGLSNLPPELPEGAMVIVNDRTPIRGHDPKAILGQLQELEFACLLLDLQRPDVPETAALVKIIAGELDRPVGVSQLYAGDLDCPVFLPPVPPDVPPEEYLKPWKGREVWLEAALGGLTRTVTARGSEAAPLLCPPETGQAEEALNCHYNIILGEDRIDFELFRTRADLNALLEKASRLGVTQAVGLWQELGR